jgi:hypothetical protein
MVCLHRRVLSNCFRSKKDPTHATTLSLATGTSLMWRSRAVKLSTLWLKWAWFATTLSTTSTRGVNYTKCIVATLNSSACCKIWSEPTSLNSFSALSLPNKSLTSLLIELRSYKNGYASLDCISCARSLKIGWSSNTTRSSLSNSSASQSRSGKFYPHLAAC